MKDFLIETYAQHTTLIIFLHVISAVIWVGGMIAMRFAAHYSFSKIEDGKTKLTRSIDALKNLFIIVSPFIIILIITAVIMAVGLGFRAAAVDVNGNVIDAYAMSIYNIVHVKESIWLIMSINFIAMVLLRNKAQKALKDGDIQQTKQLASTIATYMVPLNIILGIVAIYLGVTLRGAY